MSNPDRGKGDSGQERILVVDDSPDTLEVVQRNLSAEGYVVLCVTNVMDAVELLESEKIDLVITDFKMPRISGLELIHHIRENYKNTEVMMITGYASVEGAVAAVKNGADEYLPKPFTAEELLGAVRRAMEKLRLRRSLDEEGTSVAVPPGFVGDSEPMQQVYRMISRAAQTTATVLVTGESGTGKELVARGVHYGSSRAAAPFVAVNCGGIPEGLLESELFGHVRGAFTGAHETRAGFFQTADGGTLFLDEVGEMAMSMQVKLLRVLQDKEICMVGSTRTVTVDVRVIAATNKNLVAMIEKGLFREDLFYRLNVITVTLPPLRSRGDDILKIAGHFVHKIASEIGLAPPRFSDQALRLLTDYHWPGNVRELENTIHRLVLMTEGDVIDAPDLPALMRVSTLPTSGLNRTLAEVEQDHIRNVLSSVGGNISQAARILGIDRKTLRTRLKNPESGEQGRA